MESLSSAKNFEDAYDRFRINLRDITDFTDFLKEYETFNNIMARMYMYEVLMVIDRLNLNEKEMQKAFKDMSKMFQLDMESDGKYIQLYYAIKAKLGGWEAVIPSVAVSTEENEIGTFWMCVIAAVMNAKLERKGFLDLLKLHADYILKFSEEMIHRYKLQSND